MTNFIDDSFIYHHVFIIFFASVLFDFIIYIFIVTFLIYLHSAYSLSRFSFIYYIQHIQCYVCHSFFTQHFHHNAIFFFFDYFCRYVLRDVCIREMFQHRRALGQPRRGQETASQRLCRVTREVWRGCGAWNLPQQPF